MEALLLLVLPMAVFIIARIYIWKDKDDLEVARERYAALNMAFGQTEYGEVFQQVLAALSKDPKSGYLKFLAGKYHLLQGEYRSGLLYFSQATSVSTGMYEAYLLKGLCYYNLMEYDEALIFFDKAIWFSHEKCAEAFRMRGLTRQKLGFLKKAELDLQKALQMGDEFANYSLLLEPEVLNKNLSMSV